MKKLTLTITLLLITTALANAYEQRYKVVAPLVPGTDKVEEVSCPVGKAFVYDVYTIYSEASPDYEGQDLFIHKTEDGQDPCRLAKQNAYYFIRAGQFGGANQFVGMYGDKLFLDQWPGRDHKRLLILELPTRSILFFDWYDEPELRDDTLYYNKVLKAGKKTKKDIPCPEAAMWEEEGLLPIYIQKAEVNMETMKREVNPERSCKSAARIEAAMKSRYSGH